MEPPSVNMSFAKGSRLVSSVGIFRSVHFCHNFKPSTPVADVHPHTVTFTGASQSCLDTLDEIFHVEVVAHVGLPDFHKGRRDFLHQK